MSGAPLDGALATKRCSRHEESVDAEFVFSLWEYIQTKRDGVPGAFDQLNIAEFVKFFVKESSCYPSGVSVYTRTTRCGSREICVEKDGCVYMRRLFCAGRDESLK